MRVGWDVFLVVVADAFVAALRVPPDEVFRFGAEGSSSFFVFRVVVADAFVAALRVPPDEVLRPGAEGSSSFFVFRVGFLVEVAKIIPSLEFAPFSSSMRQTALARMSWQDWRTQV